MASTDSPTLDYNIGAFSWAPAPTDDSNNYIVAQLIQANGSPTS